MDLTMDTVERKARRAHEAVDVAVAKAADKVTPIIERIARTAHQTVDRMANAAVPAADWIDHNAGQMKQRQRELVDRSRGYVRERPLRAIGIALAAGYLIGRLMH